MKKDLNDVLSQLEATCVALARLEANARLMANLAEHTKNSMISLDAESLDVMMTDTASTLSIAQDQLKALQSAIATLT